MAGVRFCHRPRVADTTQARFSHTEGVNMKLLGLVAGSVLLAFIVVTSIKRPNRRYPLQSHRELDFKKLQRSGIDRHEWGGCC